MVESGESDFFVWNNLEWSHRVGTAVANSFVENTYKYMYSQNRTVKKHPSLIGIADDPHT